MRRILVFVVAAIAVGALGALTTAGTSRVCAGSRRTATEVDGKYGWPVKPFFRQHPVRGNLGDPRIGPGREGTTQHTLHLGVDVVAPNGTAVYATVSGAVSIHPLHRDTVVVSTGTGRALEYWHVVPSMTHGWATAYDTLIGHVEAPWAHVNLSERIGSTYVNPLRPGALTPYADAVSPCIGGVHFERDGRDLGRVLHGSVDVVVGAYDPPTLPVPAPWDDIRLAPALVRWRVVAAETRAGTAWRIAFDVRRRLPATAFFDVYAHGTRQNRDHAPGWYRFYLCRGWSTSTLRDGRYLIEVSVVDIRGNEAVARLSFVVANL